jgi:lipopolysaccharide transport system permease protein
MGSAVQALLDDTRQLWRNRSLLRTLVRREIAARHAGTAAGALWSYIQPLLTVAVYYLVFDIVFAMRLGEQAPVRAVGTFLIVGSLPWMAFCEFLNRGMTSLVDAGGLLQKNALPPVLCPVRSVLASSVVYGPLILALVPLYGAHHQYQSALLALPVLMLLQTLLALFMAYLLAIFAAALRDTVQVVGFLLSLGVFISPILFPVSQFPENWRWALWVNPITPFVLAYQSVFLQGQWPPLAHWGVMLLWVLGCGALLSLVLGRSRDHLVDWL